MNNQQQIEQQFNLALKRELSKHNVKFLLKEQWRKNALQALRHTTPFKLGVTAEEFEEIVDNLGNSGILTCYQFAIVNNNLELCSAKDLQMANILDFCELQYTIEEFARMWNNQTAPIREKITEELITPLKTPGGLQKVD